MKSKRQIKAVKKDIATNTAISVGYRLSVIQALPSYAITEALRSIQRRELISGNSTDADINNIFVTECVKAMNYQDFKTITKYFFC